MRILAVVVCLLALTACSEPRTCTLIAARAGIGLEIALPAVRSAALEVCWDGTCVKPGTVLSPATTNGPETCSGTGPDAVCGVPALPAAGLTGFADLTTLPAKAVAVKLTLTDAAGAVLLDETVTVTPKLVHPNGEGCGGEAAQAGLEVSAAGVVTERG